MRVRTRFIVLFAVQSIVAAAVSIVFAYRAMGTEYVRVESEYKIPELQLGPALDASLSDRERLAAALKALGSLRASSAASRMLRSQAMVETVVKIGMFMVFETCVAALLFAFFSMPLTTILVRLSTGARLVAADRSFRFGAVQDREFLPVFKAFDDMLDTIRSQELRLGEAARLEGWKEVSSFLFHQIRSPLAGMEMAAHNMELAAQRAASGGMTEAEALSQCSSSSLSALRESARIRALLDRFRNLSGLSMGALEELLITDIFDSIQAGFPPGKVIFGIEGETASILGDRRMLEEAFMNIVQNSVEACPAEQACIYLVIRKSEGFAILEFSDTNGMVDPLLIDKAGIERFSTKKQGTGLGLLFVRRVAALHSGRFEAFIAGAGGFGIRLALPLFPGEET